MIFENNLGIKDLDGDCLIFEFCEGEFYITDKDGCRKLQIMPEDAEAIVLFFKRHGVSG